MMAARPRSSAARHQLPSPATKFNFLLPADPTSNATSGYYGRLWQNHRLAIEGNIFDLVPTQANSWSPTAIALGWGFSGLGPPIFSQALAARNIVRHVDGQSDPGGLNPSSAFVVSGCGKLLERENVVDLNYYVPIQ